MSGIARCVSCCPRLPWSPQTARGADDSDAGPAERQDLHGNLIAYFEARLRFLRCQLGEHAPPWSGKAKPSTSKSDSIYIPAAAGKEIELVLHICVLDEQAGSCGGVRRHMSTATRATRRSSVTEPRSAVDLCVRPALLVYGRSIRSVRPAAGVAVVAT